MADLSATVIPKASLADINGDTVIVFCGDQTLRFHDGMTQGEWRLAHAQVDGWLMKVATRRAQRVADQSRATFADPDAIDDATNVYGDLDLDYPPDDCDKSPNGHHEYDALRDPERCVHCGRRT